MSKYNNMESVTKKYFWNLAGSAGLMLGMISSASMFTGQGISTMNISSTMGTLIGGALWLAETCGCIGMMYYYMKKFSSEFPSLGYKAISRFGAAIAFLSALIYSAVIFANMAYISADFYAEQFTLLTQQLSSSLDSNSKVMLERIMTEMPQISFFSNLIYCTIFGSVVSSIISRGIITKNQISENRPDEQ